MCQMLIMRPKATWNGTTTTTTRIILINVQRINQKNVSTKCMF